MQKILCQKIVILGTFLHSSISKIFATRASTLKLICGYISDFSLSEKNKNQPATAAFRILALGKKIRFWPLFGNRPEQNLLVRNC